MLIAFPTRHRRLPVGALLLLATVAILAVGLIGLAGCGGTASTTTSASTATTASQASATTAGSSGTTGSSSSPATTPGADVFPVTVTDDAQRSVTIPKQPQRIVSTAPANTEILFAVGVGAHVVGVSSLDDYPAEVKNITKVGDFKVNAEAVTALNPDLVVAYSGNEEDLAPLVKGGVPVLILNPSSLEGVYQNIELVGAAVGDSQKAAEVIAAVKAKVAEVSAKAKAAGTPPKVFYALDNTLFTVGPGSFVDEMLQLAGATNVAANGPKPYFQYTPEELVAADPDLILLPTSMNTGTDVFMKDPRFVGLRAVKEGQVRVVDDLTVTRPGPRIGEGLETLAKAIHPNAF